jgi:lipopolysaccharide export system protein LptA
MKGLALALLILAIASAFVALGQVPQGTQLRRTKIQVDRDTPEGKKLDLLITGSSVSNLSGQAVLVREFNLKSFHNGDPSQVQIIAEAPECQVDLSDYVASDAGPLKVFTPTTNVYLQGVGFVFTQSNHFLVISNDVATRVVKSVLRSSAAASRTNAAEVTNTPVTTNADQIIRIFAVHGEFGFDSDRVDYATNVHMIDPQLDLTSDFLTIRFNSNGAVETMLARDNVVLTTTNNGRATGAVGFYYVTNKNEMMRLSTNATWRNGEQTANADEFTYDRDRHFLTLRGNVRVHWPIAATNNPGAPAHPPTGTNQFYDLSADFATLQFPPTNGPLESMQAQGHVKIVNHQDQSTALAEEAVYERKTGGLELTGNPSWQNSDIEVKGDLLAAQLNDKIYHARNNAHLKMRTSSNTSHATNQPAGISEHSTNQWVYISSDEIEYHTNLAVFSRHVKTRLVEDSQLRDTLNCHLLTMDLTNNQVSAAYAKGNVYGETAPDKAGMVKTITCAQLNAYRSVKTGLMKSVDAHTDVIIYEKGTVAGAVTNRLTADTVTAEFSAVTNRIEHATAEPNVIIDQFKPGQTTHVTAGRAVYTAGTNADDQVQFTGTPLAHTERYSISQADLMIWRPKSNSFQAFGLYKIIPVTPAHGQKSL